MLEVDPFNLHAPPGAPLQLAHPYLRTMYSLSRTMTSIGSSERNLGYMEHDSVVDGSHGHMMYDCVVRASFPSNWRQLSYFASAGIYHICSVLSALLSQLRSEALKH